MVDEKSRNSMTLSPRRHKNGETSLSNTSLKCVFATFLMLGFVFTVSVNLMHDQVTYRTVGALNQAYKKALFARFTSNVDSSEDAAVKKDPIKQEKIQGEEWKHSIAGLTCEKHGGPLSEELTKEMVYWSDIPSDADYMSPFKHKKKGLDMYLTFEPDGGGWNNIRMAMETVVVMAHAMGRTLVLPPEQGMYLLRKDKTKQKVHFSFSDFFHLDTLHMEHSGIDIISMEEYLLREGMTGNLVDKDTGKVLFPPGNRTNWNGENSFPQELKDYLRQISHTPLWKPDSCMLGFPATAEIEDTKELQDNHKSVMDGGIPQFKSFINNPTAVDAPAADRMREMIAERKEMCVYDQEMQKTKVIHFMCYHKMRVRLLVHFYAFLFFEDWRHDTWSKRFVRDHLRYIDELQCAAARIVNAVRERVRKKQSENAQGIFDSMHIRRGDFQYKGTRIEAAKLVEKSSDLIPANTTVYIATDEKNKSFFKPLGDKYDVVYLDDFKHLIEGINTNYYGMIDQLIASRGRVFIGTYHSTFTGFINRMRGYHAVKNSLPKSENGIIESYYFVPDDMKHVMKEYWPVKRAFWAREFPTAWRDIDKGIGELVE